MSSTKNRYGHYTEAFAAKAYSFIIFMLSDAILASRTNFEVTTGVKNNNNSQSKQLKFHRNTNSKFLQNQYEPTKSNLNKGVSP